MAQQRLQDQTHQIVFLPAMNPIISYIGTLLNISSKINLKLDIKE
jgi:hypothetical protein